MIGLGVLWCSFILINGWLLAEAFVRGEPLLRLVEDAPWLVVAALCLLFLLAIFSGLFLIGFLCLLDAWHLHRIRLVIDHRGVSRVDGHRLTVPWEQIRHVTVTPGKQRWRRLLVDNGTVPVSFWDYRSTTQAGRAQRRLLPGVRGFAVNILIGRLDVPAEVIVEAVHYFSGGRFPDR